MAAVRAEPWHYGEQVQPGPSFDSGGFGGQLTSARGDLLWAQVTTLCRDDFVEWAMSCLQLGAYKGMQSGYLSGWSPGRSVAVRVLEYHGWETLYYRAGDTGDYDLNLINPARVNLGMGCDTWYRQWGGFLRICIHMEITTKTPGLVKRMIMRELNFWPQATVLTLGKHLGYMDVPKAWVALKGWSFNNVNYTLEKLAKSCVFPELFDLYPNLVLVLVLAFRRSLAYGGVKRTRVVRRSSSFYYACYYDYYDYYFCY